MCFVQIYVLYTVLHVYYTHKHRCLYLHMKSLVYVESMGIFIMFEITLILPLLLKDYAAEYRILG